MVISSFIKQYQVEEKEIDKYFNLPKKYLFGLITSQYRIGKTSHCVRYNVKDKIISRKWMHRGYSSWEIISYDEFLDLKSTGNFVLS